MLGSVSVIAQTNVYSLNAVGYTTVTIPAGDFSIIACPLIVTPDNTVSTLMNNSNGSLTLSHVYFYSPANGYSIDDALTIGGKKGQTSNPNGWGQNGTNVLAPGVACWFQNNTANPVSFTFVGQVPTGSLTNTIAPGYNLISSAVPMTGDLQTNSISALTNYNVGDILYMYDPVQAYSAGIGGVYDVVANTGKHPGTGYNNNWSPGDAQIFNVTQGFWYFNATNFSFNWVENFTVNP